MDYKVGERPPVTFKHELPKVFYKYYKDKILGQDFNQEELEELTAIVSGILGALIALSMPDVAGRKVLNEYLFSKINAQFDVVEKERLLKEKATSNVKSASDPIGIAAKSAFIAPRKKKVAQQ
jgi:hypothetical protein